MTRKISEENENFFDNMIIRTGEYFIDDLHAIGVTPNMITTLSLVTGLLTALLLSYSNYVVASGMFLISYTLDCMDGTMARKFSMESVFGDYYDHISDVTKTLIIFAVLYNNDPQKFMYIAPFFIMFAMLTFMHFGCQEKHSEHIMSESLGASKYFCIDKEYISYTKWFGCGTLTLITVIIFMIYKFF